MPLMVLIFPVSLYASSRGSYLFIMVLQATVKSYAQSSLQPTCTSNFFSPLSWIKDILVFPGHSE